MTLTIPTRELVGALADVIPFASAIPDDYTLGRVLIEWDGETLHTMATDRYTVGWSRWNPDDAPVDGEEPAEDDLFTEWGESADRTWSKQISLLDAKEIVKVYKLPAKAGGVPVLVTAGFKTLTLDRKPESGHTAITMEFLSEPDERYPDVRAFIDTAEAMGEPVGQIMYNPRHLAAFDKVRPHGQFQRQFGGETKPTFVRIGERFTGLVMPVRPDRNQNAVEAPDA
ncbi:MAG TPA: hypothetical protein VIS06_10930 [Mycobacteriales bacterium]